MQLPEHYVNALALERRVRLELERDHIGVWPESTTPSDRVVDGEPDAEWRPKGDDG
jgi:hypothetical protein